MEAWRGELYHYGIRGQKWGVRRFQNPDGTLTAAGKSRYRSGADVKAGSASLMTKMKASRDAKETARAKMYYGEGAGNRRKLIKAKVEERSKDPDYKAEYEKALAKQNMAEHATKAKAERTVRDTGKTIRAVYKTGKAIASLAVTAATTYALAKEAMENPVVRELTSSTIGKISTGRNVKKGRRVVNEWGGVNTVDPMLDWKQTL